MQQVAAPVGHRNKGSTSTASGDDGVGVRGVAWRIKRAAAGTIARPVSIPVRPGRDAATVAQRKKLRTDGRTVGPAGVPAGMQSRVEAPHNYYDSLDDVQPAIELIRPQSSAVAATSSLDGELCTPGEDAPDHQCVLPIRGSHL